MQMRLKFFSQLILMYLSALMRNPSDAKLHLVSIFPCSTKLHLVKVFVLIHLAVTNWEITLDAFAQFSMLAAGLGLLCIFM